MINWTKMRQRSIDLFINSNAMEVVVTKTVSGTFDATTGTVMSSTSASYTFRGFEVGSIETNVDGKVREFSTEFKGPTDIAFIDAKLTLSPQCVDNSTGALRTDIMPEVGDVVSYGGNVYTVKVSNPVSPVAGFVLTHRLEIRK